MAILFTLFYTLGIIAFGLVCGAVALRIKRQWPQIKQQRAFRATVQRALASGVHLRADMR